jgi:hypothetical protein
MPFWWLIHNNPTGTNKLTPSNFQFALGVTPYPTVGNAALLATLKAANVNVFLKASEGGLNDVVLAYGRLINGRPMNYWYAIDWLQINAAVDVTAAVIEGSNNSSNPLVYNQPGINTLQGVLSGTCGRGNAAGILFGAPIQTELVPSDLAQALADFTYAGQTLVNADPFVDYVSTNPSDFPAGIYNGLFVQMTPNQGFESIGVAINVTDFIAGA